MEKSETGQGGTGQGETGRSVYASELTNRERFWFVFLMGIGLFVMVFPILLMQAELGL